MTPMMMLSRCTLLLLVTLTYSLVLSHSPFILRGNNNASSTERRLLDHFDFTMNKQARKLDVEVDATDDTILHMDVQYGYSGNTEFQSLAFEIRDPTCKIVIPSAPIQLRDPAITYRIMDPATNPDGTLTLHMSVNYVAAQDISAIWNVIDGHKGVLEFCVHVDFFYDSVNVNSVSSGVKLTATGSGTFGNPDMASDLTMSDPVSASFDFDFPLAIFPCDRDYQALLVVPTIFPGQPVRFCITLATPSDSARVSKITQVSYKSMNPALPTIDVILDGNAVNSLGGAYCPLEQNGVCMVEFIPRPSHFVNVPLVCQGKARISLGTPGGGTGTDGDTTRGAGTGNSGNTDNNGNPSNSGNGNTNPGNNNGNNGGGNGNSGNSNANNGNGNSGNSNSGNAGNKANGKRKLQSDEQFEETPFAFQVQLSTAADESPATSSASLSMLPVVESVVAIVLTVAYLL